MSNLEGYTFLASFPFLNQQKIANIVWTAERVKPASIIEFLSDDAQAVGLFIEFLQCWDLTVAYTTKTVESVEIKIVWIAHERSIIDEAIRLERAPTPANREAWAAHTRAYGKVYGYPDTAIEGFITNQKIDEEALLPNVLSPEDVETYLALRPFRLSVAHWQEEVGEVMRWICVLRDWAPQTLRFMLAHHRLQVEARACLAPFEKEHSQPPQD